MILQATTAMLAAITAIPLSAVPQPHHPYAEVTGKGIAVNGDLLIRNASDEDLTLVEVLLETRDANGRLLQRKELNGNGTSPSIELITDRKLPRQGELLVYNPFPEFASDVAPTTLHFTLKFEAGQGRVVNATAEIAPMPAPREKLRMPIRGQVLVWDGHDFYSHHRRVNLALPILRDAGYKTNSGRYSYDFVALDSTGRRSKGDENANANWFSFGEPVLAVADAQVVDIRDELPDDRNFDVSTLSRANAIFGNYVILRLSDGTYALYGHLQRGSISVRAGQTVRAGDDIAKIGASGWVIFPHLHFQLMDGPTDRSEGVPSRFEGVKRVNGTSPLNGYIDSGDILVAR